MHKIIGCNFLVECEDDLNTKLKKRVGVFCEQNFINEIGKKCFLEKIFKCIEFLENQLRFKIENQTSLSLDELITWCSEIKDEDADDTSLPLMKIVEFQNMYLNNDGRDVLRSSLDSQGSTPVSVDTITYSGSDSGSGSDSDGIFKLDDDF